MKEICQDSRPNNDDYLEESPSYCRMGNFSDVKTLANLAINSFSLKLQVANLVGCSTIPVLVLKFVL